MKTKFLQKLIILVIALSSASLKSSNMEELPKIQSKIDSLNLLTAELDSTLASLNVEIKNLEQRKMKIIIENDTTSCVLTKLSRPGYLKKEPTLTADILMKLPSGTEVLVIGYSDKYFESRVGEELGYIYKGFFKADDKLEKISNYQANLKSSSSSHSNPKSYRSSRNSSSSSKSYSPSRSSRSRSKTRTIHTGPRGGKYYINSKGKKVYIKRK